MAQTHLPETAMLARLICLSLLSFMLAAPAKADPPPTWNGLVLVKSKSVEAAYLLPGSDFRSYTQVLIDPSVISFQKDWLRNINESQPIGDLSQRITPSQAQDMLKAMQQAFDQQFAQTLQAAGYTLASAPGPGVLRLSPQVANLYINAPDPQGPTMSRSYAVSAGEATLALGASDSQTNTRLAEVVDQRETQNSGRMQFSNQNTNKEAFIELVTLWANTAAKGLSALKAASPVPAQLTPGQEL